MVSILYEKDNYFYFFIGIVYNKAMNKKERRIKEALKANIIKIEEKEIVKKPSKKNRPKEVEQIFKENFLIKDLLLTSITLFSCIASIVILYLVLG